MIKNGRVIIKNPPFFGGEVEKPVKKALRPQRFFYRVNPKISGMTSAPNVSIPILYIALA